jgi:hypothetical protein
MPLACSITTPAVQRVLQLVGEPFGLRDPAAAPDADRNSPSGVRYDDPAGVQVEQAQAALDEQLQQGVEAAVLDRQVNQRDRGSPPAVHPGARSPR